MIKPSRTDRDITFCRYPLVTVSVSVLQFAIFRIARIHFARPQERPVGSSGKSVLVTYPAATGTSVGENNGLWLEFIQYFIDTWIVVVSLAVDGTAVFGSAIPSVTAVGTVKPNLEYFAIIGHQLSQLFMEIIYIFRCTVVSLVSVPGREINGEFNAVFLTGGCQFTYNISFTVLVRSVTDTIFCQFGRPQAKAIMVFGGKDYSFHTRFYKGFHPLFAVQLGWVERFRVRISVSPFTVVESVQTEVNESIRFHFLPFHLFFFGNR